MNDELLIQGNNMSALLASRPVTLGQRIPIVVGQIGLCSITPDLVQHLYRWCSRQTSFAPWESAQILEWALTHSDYTSGDAFDLNISIFLTFLLAPCSNYVNSCLDFNLKTSKVCLSMVPM